MSTEIQWHRGDINPKTGLVFWQAWKMNYGKNRIRDLWLTQVEFKRRHKQALETKRIYYQHNRAKHRELSRKWDACNRDLIRENRRLWLAKGDNRERANASSLAWKKRNPDRFREAARRRRLRKRHEDLLFRLKLRCRGRIVSFLKRRDLNKQSRTMEIIGCTPEFLKAHLEQQFTGGMTWENYGRWEIDHRVPLAIARTEIELLTLCHFTNLQPLWQEQNRAKGARVC